MAFGDNFQVTRPNFGTNPLTFFKESYAELRKVSWPKRSQLISLTLVVIGVSFAIGVYLGGLDFVFTKMVELVLSKR